MGLIERKKKNLREWCAYPRAWVWASRESQAMGVGFSQSCLSVFAAGTSKLSLASEVHPKGLLETSWAGTLVLENEIIEWFLTCIEQITVDKEKP